MQDRRQTERGNGHDRRQDAAGQKAQNGSVGNVSGEFKNSDQAGGLNGNTKAPNGSGSNSSANKRGAAS